MNRLEWTQKEPYIEYHVLKWSTSHLHPRRGTNTDAGFALKGKMPGLAEAAEMPAEQQEGIGWAESGRHERVKWRSGGFGQDGMVEVSGKDAVHDKDSVSVSARQKKSQLAAQEAVAVAAQPTIPVETYSAAYGTVHKARQTVQKIGGRIQNTVGRLRDIYQRQKKSAAFSKKKGRYTQSQKEQRGTRRVSKDDVLAMQSENNYLLDSYDRNGQYSMLGK